jgi:hypothetical protein
MDIDTPMKALAMTVMTIQATPWPLGAHARS